MKLLSAEMSVIWKPMTQSILYTWNVFTFNDLKQESWSWRAETGERTNLNLAFGMLMPMD